MIRTSSHGENIRCRSSVLEFLMDLVENLDMAYMERRIRAETAGDHGIEILTNAA